MKQIVFKKISIKNFLSVGNTPLEIDFKNGLNIITGINLDKENSQNGVGKSTITDALYFALFGLTIRELKKEQIVNNINKKNCKVMVAFDVIDNAQTSSYVLVRGISPTKTQLFKNGTDVTPSSIVKTTEKITSLLNATPEVFQNAVIMSVNNMIPFMAQKKVDKRKFIEGILRLGIFSDMLLLARQDFNDSKRNADIEQTKINEIEKTYNNYIIQQQEQEQIKNDRINVLLGREKDNTIQINLLEPTLKDIPDNKITDFENGIVKLKEQTNLCKSTEKTIFQTLADNNAKLNHIDKQIKLIDEIGDVCYTCKRPFKLEEDKLELNKQKEALIKDKIDIAEKIEQLKVKLDSIEKIEEDLQQKLESYNAEINKLKNSIKDNISIKEKLNQLKAWNKQIKIDIEELNNQHDMYSTQIVELKQRLDVLNETLKNIKSKLSTLEAVKFIVSEEGVKSFIVKKILKILNGRLAYYLKRLDSNCTCIFNEYFEETIITDKGQECSYHNFSGGERRRIDLAMLFTFMDIRRLQSNVSINVSFYDEILDTSLDYKGIDLLTEILQERVEKYNEAIYIISHKKSAVKKVSSENVIYLEKKNGFTYMSNLNKVEE